MRKKEMRPSDGLTTLNKQSSESALSDVADYTHLEMCIPRDKYIFLLISTFSYHTNEPFQDVLDFPGLVE